MPVFSVINTEIGVLNPDAACQASIGLCKVDALSKKAVTGPVPIYWGSWNLCCIAQVSVAELPYLNSWSCSKPYKIQGNATLDQKFSEQIGLQSLKDIFCSSYVWFNCRGSCRAVSCWNMALCNVTGPYWLLTNSWLIKSIWFHIFCGNISRFFFHFKHLLSSFS